MCAVLLAALVRYSRSRPRHLADRALGTRTVRRWHRAFDVGTARAPLTLVGRVLFGVVAIFGAATTVFALATHLIVSLVALAILGAADAVSVVIRFSLVQLRTPPEMRGRVSAVNGMFTGTSNYLGDFRAGAVAALIGAVPAVAIGGIGVFAVALIWLFLFPELRRIRSFDERLRARSRARPTRSDCHGLGRRRHAARLLRGVPGLSFSHIQWSSVKARCGERGRAQPWIACILARPCGRRRCARCARPRTRRKRRRIAPS